MRFHKIKSFIMQYWILYLVGFAIVFGIKYFYSRADSNDLEWILAPTAWWVRILGKISFEREPGIGYINHFYKFIIAPSCSGVQFMIITTAALIYSYVHRMKTLRRGFCWIALSVAASYVFTVFVNSIRIILAIYIPHYFKVPDSYSGWLTPERLHTTIGIVVYFTSLFVIYHLAGYVSQKIADMFEKNPNHTSMSYTDQPFLQIIRKYIPPLFWYFSITLGIPFLNRASTHDNGKFAEYAMLISVVCLFIVFLFCLVSVVRRHFCASDKKHVL